MYKFFKILLWTQFWRPEKLFKIFLKDIAIISNQNSIEELQTVKAKQILNAISIILFIFFVRFLQCVSLWFYQNNAFYRFITYDIIFFLNCPPSMSVYNISFGGQLIFFFYRSYFFAENNQKVYPTLLVHKIFYQNYEGYFLNNFKIKNTKKVKWSLLIKKYIKIYQYIYQSCLLFYGNFIFYIN